MPQNLRKENSQKMKNEKFRNIPTAVSQKVFCTKIEGIMIYFCFRDCTIYWPSGVHMCSMLRPIVEFCSVVYHPMLNNEQSLRVERLQKIALKIVFGFGLEYDELLEKAGIERLEERRKKAFNKVCPNYCK